MTGNRISEVTCPVCTQFGKGDIRIFHSEWTLSWHIAYEAKMCTGGDQLHRKWVDRNCGELNFKEYNIKETIKLTIHTNRNSGVKI